MLPKSYITSLIFIAISYLNQVIAVTTFPASWIPTDDFLVGNKVIVNTPNDLQPANYTITVPYPNGRVYPSAPQVATAVSRYLGAHDFSHVGFFTYKVSAGTSSCNVNIVWPSEVNYFEFKFIIVAQTFPFYINLIGNYVLMSSTSMTNPTSINKNIPIAALPNPISNYRVLIFLTCYNYWGTIEPTGVYYPPFINFTASVTSPTNVFVNTVAGTNGQMNYTHVTVMVFDYVSINSSPNYRAGYDRVLFDKTTGGEIALPQGLEDNILIGFTDFVGTADTEYLSFNLTYGPISGNQTGISFPPPTPAGPSVPSYGFSYFYVQTLGCPNSSYYLNTTSGQCTECAIMPNCSTCIINKCLTCFPGHQLDAGNLSCSKISCTDTNCLLCSSPSVCIQCDYTDLYYVLGNNTCGYCDNTTNKFINFSSSSYPCVLCTPTNCQVCGTINECQNCSNSSYMLNPSDKQCYLCSSTVTNCQSCSSYLVCQTCTSPYVLNTSDTSAGGQCISCPLTGCTTCYNITACSTCDYGSGYGIQSNMTCRSCDSLIQQFINSTSQECEICSIPQCTNCANLTFCIMCDTPNKYYNVSNGTCQYCNSTLNNFINVNTYYTCDHCTLTECVVCTNLTACTTCNLTNNYVLNSSSLLCQYCSLPNCLQCQTIAICKTCDQANQYFLNSNTGLCQFYQAQFLSIEKDGCNGFVVKVQMIDKVFQIVKNQIMVLNSGIFIHRVMQDETKANILIYAEYTRNILNESILLKLSPGQTLSIDYKPFIPALYYSFTECQNSQKMESLVLAFEIMSYINLLLSLFSCKIVGLELFGVLQLAYFSLSSHTFLNIYLGPLVKLRAMNGINVGLVKEHGNVPPAMQNMGVSSNFLNNCNIMLFILLGQLILTGVMYLLSRLAFSLKIQRYTLYFFKQALITLILFNVFNISFSAGVHWKYAEPTDDHYTLSTVVLVGSLVAMLTAAAAMEFTDEYSYGEFKEKFKLNWQCKMFIPLTVVYRMCLGFYCAVKTDDNYSTIIAMGIALIFVLYVVVNLPFTEPAQNYRSCICHATMLVILFTTNYYRTLKINTPMQVKATIFTPSIIQLALIGVCIGVSTAVLLHEFFNFFKGLSHNKKKIRSGILNTSISSQYINTQTGQESMLTMN